MTAPSNDPWASSNSDDDIEHEAPFDDNFAETTTATTHNLTTDIAPENVATENVLVHTDTVPKIPVSFSVQDPLASSSFLSQEDYAKKLEDKLRKLQTRQQPNGKDMLQNLKEKKDLYLSELMSGLQLDEGDQGLTSASSFLDRLYHTNGVYRHLNPQQALDSSEKEPFANHDYLNDLKSELDASDPVDEQEG